MNGYQAGRQFLIILLSSLLIPAIALAVPDDFWSHWGDGKAEITSYQLEIPQYREPRKGQAVLIFVTEDFRADKQVKIESSNAAKTPVLKLNNVRDFRTGAYPYHTMLSSFAPLAKWDLGTSSLPMKLSLSTIEWCGNFYSQLNTRKDDFNFTRHSYFELEADSTLSIKKHQDGIFEDNLHRSCRY